jgi:hypothetical protein
MKHRNNNASPGQPLLLTSNANMRWHLSPKKVTARARRAAEPIPHAPDAVGIDSERHGAAAKSSGSAVHVKARTGQPHGAPWLSRGLLPAMASPPCARGPGAPMPLVMESSLGAHVKGH